VVITRRGKPVARVVAENPLHPSTPGWVERLRCLHGDQPGPEGSAVDLLRQLRDEQP